MSWFGNMFGDPRTANVAQTKQDYATIKQQCLASGTLFEDPIFSPRVAGAKSKGEHCEWIRPTEIVDDPKFIIDGVSRFDAVQGGVGDCWLVSSASILAHSKRLFTRVVPPDQKFTQEYCGLFRFRFWQYGKWIEVVIDDRLPVRDGKLLFMRSHDPNEFWSPLLEKAYAKIHGSYAALVGGTTSEALVDFTGGITEYHDLQGPERPENIFSIMKKAHERCSLMGASIEATSEADREAELESGLIKGHAYSITNVTELSLGGRSVRLLRLRNPWSGTSEWKGSWSDSSPEWSMISEYERRRLGLTFDADGEFWMSCDDFEQNFTRVEVCHLSPESLDDEHQQRKWYTHMFEGVWIQGISAGGCRNNIETFATNPQYVVTLSDYEGTGLCDIIVSLMQKHRRSKYLMGSDQLTIGFAMYEVPDGHLGREPIGQSTPRYHQQVLSTEFFQYNKSVARTPTYINLREVTNRFSLKPGKYCIIPSTYEANEGDSEFILRVWTEAPMSASEIDVKPGLYPPYPSPSNLTPTPTPTPTANSRGGGGSDAGSGYPPYPNPSVHPQPTPVPGPIPTPNPSYPSYPSMPDEPVIHSAVAPKPRPHDYPNLEINQEQVMNIISGLVGFVTNCLGNLQKSSTVSYQRSAPPPTVTHSSDGDSHTFSHNIKGIQSEPNELSKSSTKDTLHGSMQNGTSAITNGSQTIDPKVVDQLIANSKVDADQLFNKIAGFDGYLDANELQSTLNAAMKKELGYHSFTLGTCRALIAAVDNELIGKLGKTQFELLWADILKWTRAFKNHDKDNTYSIDASELRAALNEAGITVSRKLLVAIIQRYGQAERVKSRSNSSSVGPKSVQPVRRTLSLDGFIHSCVKLYQAIKFWYEIRITQKVKEDDSFRERNRRAFRPESPLSISSEHMVERFEDPGPDFIRIDLDTFLLKTMYS